MNKDERQKTIKSIKDETLRRGVIERVLRKERNSQIAAEVLGTSYKNLKKMASRLGLSLKISSLRI